MPPRFVYNFCGTQKAAARNILEVKDFFTRDEKWG